MKLIQAIVGTEPAMDDAAVAGYLRQHPDFFEDHLDLLEMLKVPHPSGEAVSLTTRQLDLLRARNGKLQQQLNDILQIARDNDMLSRRLHQLTLTLLNATSIDDALAGLRWSLHECFEADHVVVRLLEPSVETAIGDLVVHDESTERYIEGLLNMGVPECGLTSIDQAQMLFGGDADRVESHALVPLSHAGLRGLLVIGSCDPHRFDAGMGHLFLTQMGEIVAARLVNLLLGPN